VFLALRLTPGDPALILLGPQAGRPDATATLEALRKSMGLDKSWYVQYMIWLKQILHGNLGLSNRSHLPVIQLVFHALPPTAWLIGLSVFVSVPTSIFVGIWAASRRSGIVDRIVKTITTLSIAVPAVWFGLLAIIFLSVNFRLLPSGGYVSPSDNLWQFILHIIMPVMTLAFYLTGVLTRFVYTEAADVLAQDYMRTAMAMGMRKSKRLYVYAAKNAILPMITITGVQIGALIGGAVLTEAVFELGGIGQLLLSSVLGRDYQIVQGAVLLTTLVVLAFGYFADILYSVLDPRISK
jgi:peptide/nickel transport system permease protein